MPKLVDHDEYRGELLDRAFLIMAEKGYAIPMRELAQKLDVSTGKLYHYFPSKKQLFEKMTMRIGYQYQSSTTQLIPKDAGVEERLNLLTGHFLQGHAQIGAAILLSVDYARLTPKHQSAEFFDAFFAFSVETLTELLQLPESVCQFILVASDGIVLQNWISPNPDKIRMQLEMLSSMVLAYVSSQNLETSHEL